MNPNREELLFQLALEKPTEKRPAFLDAMCEGDSALRARLEALLAAHEAPDELVPESASAAKATMKLEFSDTPDEAVGQKVGRYKILERVGEGGCGVVYVAEQTEPVRRRVGLKVVKLGMDIREGASGHCPRLVGGLAL
jgi:eukaryotic-like serine/threonine-protein kinase